MFRAVLAVALAVAVLSVSLPGMDLARRSHTDGQVRADLAELERAARSLAAADEPVPGPGPRRVVTVSLPGRSWTHAGVALVRIGRERPRGDGPPTGVVTWRIRGGPTRSTYVTGPVVRPADDEPLLLVEPGRHRLVLDLVVGGDRPVVEVGRLTPPNGSRERSGRR